MTFYSKLIPKLLAITICSGILGCGSTPQPKPVKEEDRFYFFPTRQLAPQPVYGRIREVRPPEPLPLEERPAPAGPPLEPVIHLELKNATLGETAKVLGEAHRYSYYCSSLVARQRVTVNRLGTIDELAEHLAEVADVAVTVDHDLRELRVLRKEGDEQEAHLP